MSGFRDFRIPSIVLIMALGIRGCWELGVPELLCNEFTLYDIPAAMNSRSAGLAGNSRESNGVTKHLSVGCLN